MTEIGSSKSESKADVTPSSEAKSPKKQIQLFFDGTANSAAYGRWSDATNVFRMILALHYEGNQIVFYMPGVGTRRDPMSAVTARGMDEIVREAYVNLAANCLEHDDIQIFGYSRGAAAALALVDIISNVGLLWADHLDELQAVWDCYLGRRGRKRISEAEIKHLRSRIDEKVRHKQRIRFLGLFDPVPGNDWDTLTRFSNLRLRHPMLLDDHVDAAVSILSIDDNRNPSFRPVLLGASSETRKPKAIEQIWLPGVHPDVGGNADGTFLSDVALLTMIERTQNYCEGLIWDHGYIAHRQAELGKNTSIAISNERPDLKRKLLFKASREVGARPTPGQNPTEGEKLHPVFDCLDGKNFWVRSKWQRYAPENVPRERMARFTSSDDELFRTACSHALSNTKPK
jgi:uncharacterized protein (DUF2235 family)